jgi:hypothetical protein
MTIPRSLEKSTLERLAITDSRMSPGAAGGVSRHVRRDTTSSTLNGTGQAGIVVVEHGDDPDVPRPGAVAVRWVGVATPTNALDYDDWYPADVVD